MKKWILASIIASLMTTHVIAFSDSIHTSKTKTAKSKDLQQSKQLTHADHKMAQTVIVDWYEAIKKNDANKAAKLLAPQYIAIHTDNILRNKEQELASIKNAHLKGFNLSDFHFSQSGNVIIATYRKTPIEKVEETFSDPSLTSRMLILQKQDNKWVILSFSKTAPFIKIEPTIKLE